MDVFFPLVSIIMPAYNAGKYISDSIASVISQTYQNWELIIINDYSKDNTPKIIENYANADSRIKVFSNSKNVGVSETRNKGIELATGNWIAFLDSDDMWHPQKLEKQIEKIKSNSADFIFTGASYVNEKGEAYSGVFCVPEKISFNELLFQNVISCSSVLLNKRLMKNIKMENDAIHEDFATWLRILRTGIIAYAIDEPLLIYRITKDSKSGNKFKTIKMTYNVFRFIGLNPIISTYFMIRHVMASVLKYYKIYYN